MRSQHHEQIGHDDIELGKMQVGGSVEYLAATGQLDLPVELEVNVARDALVVDEG